MKKLGKTSIAICTFLMVYLLLCGIFASRPVGSGGTSVGSRTFALNSPMEEALAESADHLKHKYGHDIKVNVKGNILSYESSFPTSYGYDDVKVTITLNEDNRYGQGSCKMSTNLIVKKRTASFLAAPVHYLINKNKKAQSGKITQELVRKLTTY